MVFFLTSTLPVSQFLKMKDEEEQRKKREKELKDDDILDDDEPDRLPHDPYLNKRIHAWVLIKKSGIRDMANDVFIEPSTGRYWNLVDKDSPYILVDQVFNHKNFWINIKPGVECNDLNFNSMNESDSNDWEYVMLDTVMFGDDSEEKKGDGDEE